MSSSLQSLLIVDDDRLILQMLGEIFSKDFTILTATDGEEAIAVLRKEPVVAVLCDHMMPKVTGVEVLKECVTLQPDAVRILVTATERVQDVRDAVNLARVHRVVVKPFRVLEVSGLVKGAIREGQLERENAKLVADLQHALDEVRKREVELEQELRIRTQELKDVMGHMAKSC